MAKRGVLVVLTGPIPGREAEYEEWYDNEHIPDSLETEGFVSGRRYRLVPGAGSDDSEWTQHLVIYDLEGDDLNDVWDALQARRDQDLKSGDLVARPVMHHFFELEFDSDAP